jgi:UDP-N-acetylmuramate dehydrogenase
MESEGIKSVSRKQRAVRRRDRQRRGSEWISMEWTGVRGQVLRNVSMKRYTSMRVGGKVSYLIYPEDQSDLAQTVTAAREHGIAYRFLGNGSNVIVSDQGFDGVVIRTSKIARFQHDKDSQGARVRVGGGAPLKRLIKECATKGLSGIEKLFGIPGTVGGAIKMNAGSFGCAISDHLTEIAFIDGDGIPQIAGRDDLKLGYRTSGLGATDCVTSAELLLKDKDREAIKADMEFVWGERLSKHPMEWPSAGSVFKNRSGHPAWKAIDAAGLRGFRIGDACISSKHPNFIINMGHASALDVKSLIEKVKKEVYETIGAVMEEEVELWGFNG